VGVCSKIGVWANLAVCLLHSVRIKKKYKCGVVLVRCGSGVNGVFVEVYLHVLACCLVRIVWRRPGGVYMAGVVLFCGVLISPPKRTTP
jgi:hypothetical protein